MPKITMLKLVKSADPLLGWRPQNRHVGGILNLVNRILNVAKSSKLPLPVVFSLLRLRLLRLQLLLQLLLLLLLLLLLFAMPVQADFYVPDGTLPCRYKQISMFRMPLCHAGTSNLPVRGPPLDPERQGDSGN